MQLIRARLKKLEKRHQKKKNKLKRAVSFLASILVMFISDMILERILLLFLELKFILTKWIQQLRILNTWTCIPSMNGTIKLIGKRLLIRIKAQFSQRNSLIINLECLNGLFRACLQMPTLWSFISLQDKRKTATESIYW